MRRAFSLFVPVDKSVGIVNEARREGVAHASVGLGAVVLWRKSSRRPVSRVLSAPFGVEQPFLWDARYRAPRATNPGGRAGMPLAAALARWPAAPIRSCSRWGLPCRPCCQGRGALLPHRFTLAVARGCPRGMAVCFLWHFPWGRPRRPLAGTVFPWSPDFPPPRLRAAAAAQPSGWGRFGEVGGRCQAWTGLNRSRVSVA